MEEGRKRKPARAARREKPAGKPKLSTCAICRKPTAAPGGKPVRLPVSFRVDIETGSLNFGDDGNLHNVRVFCDTHATEHPHRVTKGRTRDMGVAYRPAEPTLAEWNHGFPEETYLVPIEKRPAYGQLFAYARKGNVAGIRRAAEKGAQIDNQGWRRLTALHFAAASGSLNAVRTLLELGADPSAQDASGNTPLHIAAAERDFGICDLLVKRGAAYDARNRNGQTPSEYAEAYAAAGSIRRRRAVPDHVREM